MIKFTPKEIEILCKLVYAECVKAGKDTPFHGSELYPINNKLISIRDSDILRIGIERD